MKRHPASTATLTSAEIGKTIQRRAKTLAASPESGRGTSRTRVVVRDGTKCEITEGPWRMTTDLAPEQGGRSEAPLPGTLGRAALGSCMASAYVTWASRLGVPIHGLTVEVEADYDARGELGVGGVSAAYREVRCVVTVETDAPERDVCEVLRAADEHCVHLQVFSQPVRVVRETWFALPPAQE